MYNLYTYLILLLFTAIFRSHDSNLNGHKQNIYYQYLNQKTFTQSHTTLDSVTVTPVGKEVSPNKIIHLSFSSPISSRISENVTITYNSFKNGPDKFQSVEGSWQQIKSQSYTFTPIVPFNPGNMIAINISDSIKKQNGETLNIPQHLYSFLTDDGVHIPFKEKYLPNFHTVRNGAHTLPLRMIIPETDQSHPVLFWVHGGGWSGGTPNKSVAPSPEQGQYLAEHLGIMTVAISYRCKGSNGTFSEAMQDVMYTAKYFLKNAEKFNIDTTKVGFYGGSAGTPLASLAAQKIPQANCFIGYNGIYNFTYNPGSHFGNGNNYGQRIPSARANSAIYQLKKHPPRSLLLHGTSDHTINPMQSVLFAQSVRASGGKAKVILYYDEPHAFFNVGRTMEIPTLYAVKEYLKEVFGI